MRSKYQLNYSKLPTRPPDRPARLADDAGGVSGSIYPFSSTSPTAWPRRVLVPPVPQLGGSACNNIGRFGVHRRMDVGPAGDHQPDSISEHHQTVVTARPAPAGARHQSSGIAPLGQGG